MTKQKLNNIDKLEISTTSIDGVTIGELEPISTSQIKDTDLLATETDLSTNSISISQVKEVVSNSILSKTNNQLGSIIFHPAPAGYQDIPAETNGFGDAILVADGRELNKTAYIDLWNFIKVRKDKGIYGFNGETNKSFKIDELTDKITLPNLLSGDALYMGNYGLQNAIFPQHTITSGNIQPTSQPHQHKTEVMKIQPGGVGGAGEGTSYSYIYPLQPSTFETVILNPFTVSSSAISNLPAGITVGTDLKVAGVKMIPCIVCKPTYNINAGGGSGGGVATQDLDMNLFKIINIGLPVNDSDAVRLVDLKVDNNKIVYKRNGVGGYDTLQVAMDDLYNRFDFINSNFVKVDRSVLLTGEGIFNTKQVASMDDLKDTNIIVGSGVRALVTLDTKLVEVDNSISTINNNIGSVNIAGLQAQVNTNTSDIDSIKTVNTNQNNSITTLQNQVNTNTQNITSLQTVANSVYKFARKLKRTATTSLTIAGNANKRILDDVTIDSSSPYNDTTSFTLEGTTNKIIREKDDDYKELAIAITLGHTANMGATKFEVQLWRNTPTPSIVRWGSKLEFNDPDERGNTTQILTYKAGINDPYVTNGYYIVLRNLTGNVLTYSIVDILITVAKDKLLGV